MKSTIHEYKIKDVLKTSKKSIIILGLALGALTTQSFASTNGNSTKKEIFASVNSPLCAAIVKGDVEAVKLFIQYGADVNETSNGITPLMFAARYNRADIIKELLKGGANKTTKDERGNTALNYAEKFKANDAIQLLK